MTRARLLKAKHDASLQCVDCLTVAPADDPYCGACGGHLRRRPRSKMPYDAIAACIGIGAVLLFWIAGN